MLRCEYTGNPCGTDTWTIYQPCVCANCQRWICEEDTKLRARNAELEAEVARLKSWKEESLAVESTWDCQAVGRLLGVKLGEDIRSNIQPGIEELERKLAALVVELKYSREDHCKKLITLEAKLAADKGLLNTLVEAATDGLPLLFPGPVYDKLKSAIAAAKVTP